MTKIKQDRRNYRVHNDENKRVIRKSLEELGAGRSIVIDNEGEIIAGNGVYEQAQKLGIKTKIVETDGSELVVVKRTDLATGDDKRKKLALADNAASDTSEWADELLREDWTPEVLADWGVKIKDFSENDYSRKIEAPIYEPTCEVAPGVKDCVNSDKYNELIAEIDKSNVSDEDKDLLRLAAARHIVFDYKNIAERYAHADEKTKELYERSALVIIDYNKAIENGFVILTDRLMETIQDDEDE